MTSSFALGLALLGSGCSSDDDEPPQVEEPGWHIGIYMAADNNLDSAASSDLRELVQASKNGAAVVTVFIDRAAPETYRPASVPGVKSSGNARILRLSGSKFVELEDLGEVDSVATDTIHDFVQRIAAEPEPHKALILWNHGAPTGFGTDETDLAPAMHVTTLLTAFQKDLDDPSAGYHHFDVLGFDTCLLSSLSALNTFRSVSDVYIGSAELEPGAGWDYKGLMEGLTDPDADAAAFAKIAVEAYQDFYTDNPSRAGDLKVTLAAFSTDLDEVVDGLVELVEAANRINDGINLGGSTLAQAAQMYQDVTLALTRATPYSYDPSRDPRSVDMGDMLRALQVDADDENLRTAAEHLLTALENARIAWGSDEDVASALGLSINPQDTSAEIADFFSGSIGEETAGRLHLVDQDAAPPELQLSWVSRSVNPSVDFGIVKFSASDDVLLSTARISLLEHQPDDSYFVLASFAPQDSRGVTSLPSERYGVPLSTYSLQPDLTLATVDDLGMLLLDNGRLRIAVRLRVNAVETTGLLLLDEALQPVSIISENESDGTSSVLLLDEAIRLGYEVAPELGVLNKADVVRHTGTFRPLEQVQLTPVTRSTSDDLVISASVQDIAGNVVNQVIPVPAP